MYILAYKNKKSNNISSFKIQGDSLAYMYITPVEDCVVDFGDGTKQTYTGNNSSTQINHSYSESNTYTIKIIGNHSNFRASLNTIEIIQISNSITDCSQMFYSCSSLTEIPETLTIPDSVTNCSSMFSYCTSLTTIQEGFTIGNSVTNCSNMFSYCSSLTAIPETLTIPNSVTNCAQMFFNCPSLTSDISNIWPSTWNYTGTINLISMFLGCSKIVGTAPADKLWNSGKTFNSSSCFVGCTSLTNYSEIPSGWK